VTGLNNSKAKELRNTFKPKFRGSFCLANPELRDSAYKRLLKLMKGSSASKERIDILVTDLRSMQIKISDMVCPMLHVWEKLTDAVSHKAAKTSVYQLAHLTGALCDVRHKNVLSQTKPYFLSMLKRSKYFDSSEFEFIFGNHFLGEMVTSARNAAELNVASRNGGLKLKMTRRR